VRLISGRLAHLLLISHGEKEKKEHHGPQGVGPAERGSESLLFFGQGL
jgi:hypothetical protein